jgi:hypothetical protein
VVELVDRLVILVAARRFPNMGASGSRSLRCASYVRMQHFVRRYAYIPFRRFWGDVQRKFVQRLSALHGTLDCFIFAMLCNRAVLMAWHAILFLGLRPVGFFPPFSFLLEGFHSFLLCKKISYFFLSHALWEQVV